MPRQKYTLEPLVTVRRDRADQAKGELGQAIREREQQAEALEQAKRASAEQAEQASVVRGAERAALDGGGLRAVDLLRQNAWDLQQQMEAERLQNAERQALGRLQQAMRGEEGARVEASRSMADLEVVERDKERFVAAQKAAQAAQEEEAAEEAWRPRRA